MNFEIDPYTYMRCGNVAYKVCDSVNNNNKKHSLAATIKEVADSEVKLKNDDAIKALDIEV